MTAGTADVNIFDVMADRMLNFQHQEDLTKTLQTAAAV